MTVDFDEARAEPFPNCPAVHQPVSYLQVELDPLPSGEWTLEIDALLSARPIGGSIPPQTIAFNVAPAGGAVVPSSGVGALALLGAGVLSVARSALRRRA